MLSLLSLVRFFLRKPPSEGIPEEGVCQEATRSDNGQYGPGSRNGRRKGGPCLCAAGESDDSIDGTEGGGDGGFGCHGSGCSRRRSDKGTFGRRRSQSRFGGRSQSQLQLQQSSRRREGRWAAAGGGSCGAGARCWCCRWAAAAPLRSGLARGRWAAWSGRWSVAAGSWSSQLSALARNSGGGAVGSASSRGALPVRCVAVRCGASGRQRGNLEPATEAKAVDSTA